MPFNGTGQFNLDFDWNNDAANGVAITASRVQAEDQNIADGLSMCITTDGQSTTTNPIPFASGVNADTINPITANGPITFSAGQIKFPTVENPSTNSNTLDDYREAAWTPLEASGGNVGFSTAIASYTKIGRLVVVSFTVVYNTSGASNLAVIGGLPFVVGTDYGIGAISTDVNINIVARANINDTTVILLTNLNAGINISSLSGKVVRSTISYFTTS